MHVHSLMNIMRVGGVLWHQRVFGLVRRLKGFGRTILYVAPCQWITLFFYLESCCHQHVVQQVQVWPRRPQIVWGRMVRVHPEAQILLLKKMLLTFYVYFRLGQKNANLMSVMRQLWTVPRTGSKSCHPLDWFDP